MKIANYTGSDIEKLKNIEAEFATDVFLSMMQPPTGATEDIMQLRRLTGFISALKFYKCIKDTSAQCSVRR